MYKGITSYIAYMKKNYGAEPLLFSFNEADMGINVKLTPKDQDKVIKGLGASFAAAGLATKMLLGDTGNPTPRPANYIEPSIADPEAMKFVGAVSYHCWTGGSDQILARWGQVAQRFKLPLYVAEGGTDPASYRYRFLFLKPWYALDEINLYVRCLALSRPSSILHWRLTDDYSILAGGRNGEPLRPTQRFFNLKQLNLTPPEAPFAGHCRRASASHGRRLWRRRARLGDPPREHRHDPHRDAHGPAGIADDALPDRYRRRAGTCRSWPRYRYRAARPSSR